MSSFATRFAPVVRRGFRLALTLSVAVAMLIALPACRKKSPEERLTEIGELVNQKNVVGAVLKSKELIRDMPKDPVAHQARMFLARYYFDTGSPDQAHQYLSDIYTDVGLESKLGLDAFAQDIFFHRQANDNAAGIAKLDKAIQTLKHDSDTTADLTMMKADLLIRDNKPEDAIRIFNEIMLGARAESQRHEAREILANYLRSAKQFDKVADTYATFLKKFPDTSLRSDLEIAQGLALREIPERKAEGEILVEKGLAAVRQRAVSTLDKEESAYLFMTLATYLQAAGRAEESAATYEKIYKELGQTRTAAAALLKRGDLYVMGGKIETAAGLYEQVVQQYAGSENEVNAAKMRLGRIAELRKAGVDLNSTATLAMAPPTTGTLEAAKPQQPPSPAKGS